MAKTPTAISVLEPRYGPEAVALVADWFKEDMKAEASAYRDLEGAAQKAARDPTKSTGDVALGYVMLLRRLVSAGIVDLDLIARPASSICHPDVFMPRDDDPTNWPSMEPVEIIVPAQTGGNGSIGLRPDSGYAVDSSTEGESESVTALVATESEAIDATVPTGDTPVVKLCGICGTPMRQVTENRKQRGAVTYFQCPARRTHPKKAAFPPRKDAD